MHSVCSASLSCRTTHGAVLSPAARRAGPTQRLALGPRERPDQAVLVVAHGLAVVAARLRRAAALGPHRHHRHQLLLLSRPCWARIRWQVAGQPGPQGETTNAP